LIGVFVLRPLVKRMFAPLAAGGGTFMGAVSGTPAAAQLAAPAARADTASEGIPPPEKGENMIDISRIEGQVRESSVKKVGEVVSAHPEEALAILRSWLHQPV